MDLYLGIDTSAYTTSLAVVDGEGNLFSEARSVLSVNPGGRGLAQNEAVFQHVANLPVLFERLSAEVDFFHLKGVAASVRPRPVEGSYMPVFRVSESYGRSLAATWKVPFVGTSHQEGHLAAGIWSAKGPAATEFLAVHLSGGTTELLRVTKGQHFQISILGGSTDLHAGQFVDRVGVYLGLPFPAGPALEKLAREAPEDGTSLPSSVNGYDVSFSGPETAARRLLEKKYPASAVARAVEKCIAISLEKVIRKAVESTHIRDILVVGGVSANQYLRERLLARLGHRAEGAKIYFAAPSLSSDNAVGVAVIGMEIINK